MKPIEELFAEGDFDAIRQLLDTVEAEREALAKEERAKKIDAAKADMIKAIQVYGEAVGIEIREESIDRFVMTLASMEKMPGQKDSLLGVNSFKLPEGQTFTRERSKPIVISTAGNADDILKAFLEREI